MYKSIIFTIFTVAALVGDIYAAETHELEMSLDDKFIVTETDDWNVEVERYLKLRFADVKISPKRGYDFNMKLFFKCDTPDLAQFDTPQKIEQSVKDSSAQYLPYIVEKQIELQPVPLAQTFGSYTVITDAQWVTAKSLPPGEYRYMTRGMYRLSADTALGFSIMTNDIDSEGYAGLLEYVYSFRKNGSSKTAE